MLSRFFSCCLLLLAVSMPVHAGPDCTSLNATVVENEYRDKTYLTRENVNAVKKCLENQLAHSRKPTWEKKAGVDTLTIFCPGRRGNPDMKVAEVETAVLKRQEALNYLDSMQPAGGYNGDIYSFLAERTGRKKQDADVLREKYAKLGYLRYIKTPDGQQVSEAKVITERHKKKLGISDRSPDSRADKKKQRAELKEKINEAKKRGDMAEMMRLAAEGQQFAGKESDKAYEQSWQLMESQFPEMLQASYPVRFTYMPEACIE